MRDKQTIESQSPQHLTGTHSHPAIPATYTLTYPLPTLEHVVIMYGIPYVSLDLMRVLSGSGIARACVVVAML